MAEGVRRSAGSSVGVAVTGIAGPGGGRPDKPVGTVAIAVVTSEETRVRTFRFLGGREQVKDQAARAALNLLRLVLLGV
jgi:nicotinamide-nucleotide amidase